MRSVTWDAMWRDPLTLLGARPWAASAPRDAGGRRCGLRTSRRGGAPGLGTRATSRRAALRARRRRCCSARVEASGGARRRDSSGGKGLPGRVRLQRRGRPRGEVRGPAPRGALPDSDTGYSAQARGLADDRAEAEANLSAGSERHYFIGADLQALYQAEAEYVRGARRCRGEQAPRSELGRGEIPGTLTGRGRLRGVPPLRGATASRLAQGHDLHHGGGGRRRAPDGRRRCRRPYRFAQRRPHQVTCCAADLVVAHRRPRGSRAGPPRCVAGLPAWACAVFAAWPHGCATRSVPQGGVASVSETFRPTMRATERCRGAGACVQKWIGAETLGPLGHSRRQVTLHRYALRRGFGAPRASLAQREGGSPKGVLAVDGAALGVGGGVGGAAQGAPSPTEAPAQAKPYPRRLGRYGVLGARPASPMHDAGVLALQDRSLLVIRPRPKCTI